jgi:hypothetical protein
MQVTVSLSFTILPGYKAWPDNQVFKRMPEFPIEMKNIKNKMLGKRPKAFPGFNIFLSTNVAISANNYGPTI